MILEEVERDRAVEKGPFWCHQRRSKLPCYDCSARITVHVYFAVVQGWAARTKCGVRSFLPGRRQMVWSGEAQGHCRKADYPDDIRDRDYLGNVYMLFTTLELKPGIKRVYIRALCP